MRVVWIIKVFVMMTRLRDVEKKKGPLRISFLPRGSYYTIIKRREVGKSGDSVGDGSGGGASYWWTLSFFRTDNLTFYGSTTLSFNSSPLLFSLTT